VLIVAHDGIGLDDGLKCGNVTLNVMTSNQSCGVEVVMSRRFLGGAGFLTTLGVGVGFFLFESDSGCPIGSFFKSHS